MGGDWHRVGMHRPGIGDASPIDRRQASDSESAPSWAGCGYRAPIGDQWAIWGRCLPPCAHAVLSSPLTVMLAHIFAPGGCAGPPRGPRGEAGDARAGRTGAPRGTTAPPVAREQRDIPPATYRLAHTPL
ncbi:unnamed protein product [Prorocentrum cordatum]|uniref:Uncharacterized protein n=1 Tax=Prorocentrum cordatum TaxID=2364126 RepID=A0ABN9TTE2_9DINO|nr:unnamed protein product [Polarella glacialis]